MIDLLELSKRRGYLDFIVEQEDRIILAVKKLRKFKNTLYDLESDDPKVNVALGRAQFLSRGIESFVNEVMLFQRDLWRVEGKTDKECAELLRKQFKVEESGIAQADDG